MPSPTTLWIEQQIGVHEKALAALQDALARLQPVPTSARFRVVTHRTLDGKEVVNMPLMLINDMISNIPMEFDNIAGVAVEPPANDTVTLSVTDSATGDLSPVATAAMGADGRSVDVTPAQPGDTSGNTWDLNFQGSVAGPPPVTLAAMLPFAFTGDQAAASVHFLTTGITTRPLGT